MRSLGRNVEVRLCWRMASGREDLDGKIPLM